MKKLSDLFLHRERDGINHDNGNPVWKVYNSLTPVITDLSEENSAELIFHWNAAIKAAYTHGTTQTDQFKEGVLAAANYIKNEKT